MAEPSPAPGSARWVAMFAELLAHQTAPLRRGAAATRDLDAVHWSGDAASAYAEAWPRLTRVFDELVDVHTRAAARVDGHNTFVHTLPHLLHDADAAERARLESLFHTTAISLAAQLDAWSTDLDAIAPTPLVTAEPLEQAVPEPRCEPEPVAPEPVAPEPAPAPEPEPLLPAWDALLGEQVLAGERVERIRWAG